MSVDNQKELDILEETYSELWDSFDNAEEAMKFLNKAPEMYSILKYFTAMINNAPFELNNEQEKMLSKANKLLKELGD